MRLRCPDFSIAATCWLLLLVAVSLVWPASEVRGAPPAPRASTSTGLRPLDIPPMARVYQRSVTQSARRVFGLNAPVSTLAAQVHQESRWRAIARSPVGAMGLTQFMPATARDMARLHPRECAPANPLDPEWAIRCQHRYMRSLLDDLKAVPGYPPFTACSGWALGLSAYNGGAGWVARDRRRTQALGYDPNQWFGHVDVHPDPRRAARFVKENRGYPRLILLRLTPLYVNAGWGRGVTCEEPRNDQGIEAVPPGQGTQARPLRLRRTEVAGAHAPRAEGPLMDRASMTPLHRLDEANADRMEADAKRIAAETDAANAGYWAMYALAFQRTAIGAAALMIASTLGKFAA